MGRKKNSTPVRSIHAGDTVVGAAALSSSSSPPPIPPARRHRTIPTADPNRATSTIAEGNTVPGPSSSGAAAAAAAGLDSSPLRPSAPTTRRQPAIVTPPQQQRRHPTTRHPTTRSRSKLGRTGGDNGCSHATTPAEEKEEERARGRRKVTFASPAEAASVREVPAATDKDDGGGGDGDGSDDACDEMFEFDAIDDGEESTAPRSMASGCAYPSEPPARKAASGRRIADDEDEDDDGDGSGRGGGAPGRGSSGARRRIVLTEAGDDDEEGADADEGGSRARGRRGRRTATTADGEEEEEEVEVEIEEVTVATTGVGETVLYVRHVVDAASGTISSDDANTNGGLGEEQRHPPTLPLLRCHLPRTRMVSGAWPEHREADAASVRTALGVRTIMAHCLSPSRRSGMDLDLDLDCSGTSAGQENDSDGDCQGGGAGATTRTDFNSVSRAVEMGLVDVSLSHGTRAVQAPSNPSSEHSSHPARTDDANTDYGSGGGGGGGGGGVAVSVRLTSRAFATCCSASSSLSNSPPVPAPRRLPGGRNGVGWSPPHPAFVLRRALGELFPDSVLADVAADPMPFSSSSSSLSLSGAAATNGTGGSRKRGGSGVVTARMVYSVVDNVHAREFESASRDDEEEEHASDNGGEGGNSRGDVDNDDAELRLGGEASTQNVGKKRPPLAIPGLVPQLRPYQEAAVRWMLRREGKSDTSGMSDGRLLDEVDSSSGNRAWELCWVVLLSPGIPCGGGGDGRHRGGDGVSKSLDRGRILPLPQWREMHMRRESISDSGITFYSPFTGWLAHSYDEARCSTLNITRPRLSNPSEGGGGDENATIRIEETSVKGGILAESMGLGKTVEVLACVLANPCPSGLYALGVGTENGPAPSNSDELTAATLRDGAPLAAFGKERTAGGEDARTPTEQLKEMPKSSENDLIDSVTISSSGGKRRRTLTAKTLHGFPGAVCICGRSGSYRFCLSWVVCNGCREPMHGRCAGFETEEQILAKTQESDLHQQVRVCSDSHCPSCVASKCSNTGSGPNVNADNVGLISSRATLIVTPPSILSQWQREINRHTFLDGSGPLKVVVYPGVRDLCTAESASRPNEQFHLIHPKKLADADIVLMTFQSLMGDLGHSSDNPYADSSLHKSGRTNLRRRKRYRVVPSPLTSINWWRVCLDEAQRVEAPTASSAKMALKLESRHRWCVSGTPIGRGRLDDLFGLILFLQLKPFSDKNYFRNCLQLAHRDAMDRIAHLLRDMMWRSTKFNSSVREQMGIPEQVERKVHLRFSSIEKHFYERQLEETMIAADKLIKDSNGNRRTKTRDADMLSAALHKLRAACCHPQVGTSGIGRTRKRGRHGGHCTEGAASRVLTMDQILDRLIDDAKTKCEEAQRIVILHTNALACLTKLEVDAKALGRSYGSGAGKTDACLLLKSGQTYLEGLEMAEKNSSPNITVGEAMLSGCPGFRSARKVVRDGSAVLDWQIKGPSSPSRDDVKEYSRGNQAPPLRNVWARVDFEGPAKKISCIQIRCIKAVPQDLQTETIDGEDWSILRPKDCVLQVSSAAVGGEFVDACSFSFSNESPATDEWQSVAGFRTKKSKSWRVLIESYHDLNMPERHPGVQCPGLYVGIELQLMEPDIVTDDLQRLHILHNASLAFTSLVQQHSQEPEIDSPPEVHEQGGQLSDDSGEISVSAVKGKLVWMQKEAEKLEALDMEHARAIHRVSQRQLQEATRTRKKCESELQSITKAFLVTFSKQTAPQHGHHHRPWWEDLLSWLYINGDVSHRQSLCDHVRRGLAAYYESFNERSGVKNLSEDIQGMGGGRRGGGHALADVKMRKTRFPSFEDVNGLHLALNLRLQEDQEDQSGSDRAQCISSVSKLSPTPSEGEVHENSHCQECREDWHQTGPVCRHCRLEKDVVQHQRESNDPEMMCIYKALVRWVKDQSGVQTSNGSKHTPRDANHDNLFLAALHERASKFFELQGKIRAEANAAKVGWRTHFNLLSDLDELNQSKRAMRLRREDENLSLLKESELAFIVDVNDISATAMDHGAKQAMALAVLRRNKDTLRYLKNQSLERRTCRQGHGNDGQGTENCIVCLSPFQAERAVLSCGHSFHSPCLEKLVARGGGANTIICPMRCAIRTRKDDVLIATDKSKNDGSPSTRGIEGDFGTKVNRLVGDVLDTVDLGDKSLIFSQWEDMIDIITQALNVNNVKFVRPKSGKKFGSCIKQFCSSDCSVLIMNVKQGAEGLTLVEANHVFVIEPLLNCGLDIQAINRIHRIGQTSKTYVHRYIVEDTIETKIDKLRMERQENHFDDDVLEQKKHGIRAGGIDGGFSQSELQELFSP